MEKQEKLRKLLKSKHVNLTALAHTLKISRTTLYDWLDAGEFTDLILEKAGISLDTYTTDSLDNNTFSDIKIKGNGMGHNIGSKITGNTGTPDSIVERLLDTIKNDNTFYQSEIVKKSKQIETMQQSLLEKSEVIKAFIKELSLINKQNEIVANKFDQLIEKIDKVSDFAKNHDLGCKKNHIDLKETLAKNK